MAKKKPDFHVVLVLDRSGSMRSVWETTISGYNEYVDGLKKNDSDALFTFATFSSGEENIVKYVVDGILVSEVVDLTKENYQPDGGTPLRDALGTVIAKIEGDYAKAKKKPRILVMTITDGMENSSKEFTEEGLAKIISDKEKENWTFAYMGANQDAHKVASSIGIRKGNSLNYNTNEMVATFRNASYSTSDARRAHPAQVMWPGEQDKPEDSK